MEQWSLALGDLYVQGAGGFTAPAELSDGTAVVLKLVFPHRESEHEADALEVWNGDGAVRLLARDDDRFAMLIERCEPGTPLATAGAEAALDVMIALLPRLCKSAGEPFHTLADEAAWWASYLPGQWERAAPPFERSLREPWLVIDPKPLLGEREFAIAPIVRSFELGHGKREVLHRFDRLTSELGLDRERARGWTVAQTLAWTFDSHYRTRHLETAQWVLET